MPSVDFLIMNQLAASPVSICSVFWLAMMRMKNSTSAGAIRFSAVPPMVWSARRLMDAKLSSRENSAPEGRRHQHGQQLHALQRDPVAALP